MRSLPGGGRTSDKVIRPIAMALCLGAMTEGSDLTPRLQPGFPVDIDESERTFQVSPSPTFSDLEGDGSKELVTSSYSGHLWAFNDDGSAVLANEPTGLFSALEHRHTASPTVADLDRDGDMEVVVSDLSKGYVFNHDSSLLREHDLPDYHIARATAVVADLDNDGQFEIIFDRNIQDADGSPYGTLPRSFDHSSPAIADLDGDGDMEILFLGFGLNGYHHSPTTLVTGFPRADYGGITSPSVADMNGDGRLDIVAGSINGNLSLVDGRGQFLPGWPYQGGAFISSPAIADVDADTELELFIGGIDGFLYGFNPDGTFVPGFPTPLGGEIWSSPVIADIDNDGSLEIVIGCDDGRLYAFDRHGSQLFSYETGGSIRSTAAIDDWDSDGETEIAFSSTDGYLYVLKMGPGTWNPDPDMHPWPMWRGNRHHTGLYGYDADEAEQRPSQSTPDVPDPGVIRISAPEIAFSRKIDGSFQICVMEADGTNIRNLTKDAHWNDQPTWSPDGSRIAFRRKTNTTQIGSDGGIRSGYEIFVMDADGSNKTQLTNNFETTSQVASWPSWSPAGGKIAFLSGSIRNSVLDIYMMKEDGSEQGNITSLTGIHHKPSWSVDGAQLVCFYYDHTDAGGIYEISADGESAEKLMHFHMEDFTWPLNPVWSPTGESLAVEAHVGTGSDIIVTDPDGSNFRRLTHSRDDERSPAWSPDGRLIAFETRRQGDDLQIYVMRADGSGQTRLTDSKAWSFSPAWNPVSYSIEDSDPPSAVVLAPTPGRQDVSRYTTTSVSILDDRDIDANSIKMRVNGGLVEPDLTDMGNGFTVTHAPFAAPEVIAIDDVRASAVGGWYWILVQDMGREDVASVHLYIDGRLETDMASTDSGNWKYHWNATDNGPDHELLVRALDEHGVLLGESSASMTDYRIERPYYEPGSQVDVTVQADDFWGNGISHSFSFRIVGDERESAITSAPSVGVPARLRLGQNYPNPFNHETVIKFDLPSYTEVDLRLYNLTGQRLATLADGSREAGSYSLRWDGTDDGGRPVATGAYLYRLTAGSGIVTRKLLLLR